MQPGRPPPLALLLAEAPRAALEFGSLAALWPLLAAAPRGDGHPVLVLPGLLNTDVYTFVLRNFLRARGHAACAWEAGRNWGRWQALETIVLPAIERLHAEHGRKVSLVGASMGGLYARAAARRAPDLVRAVVTFSSPVRAPRQASWVTPLYEMVSGEPADALAAPHAPVPCTSVFSRSDGLGDWRPVLLPPGPMLENVEVVSTHLGMAWHPAVLYLTADRLAQPEGRWQPFTPPAWARLLYPAPAAAAAAASRP